MPGVSIRSSPANSGRPPSDLAMPGGGQQLAGGPAGAGEVDAGRPDGGVAVLQVGQLLPPAGGLVDPRLRLAPLGRLRPAEPLGLPAHLVGDRLLLPGLGLQELVPPVRELVVGAGHAEVPAG